MKSLRRNESPPLLHASKPPAVVEDVEATGVSASAAGETTIDADMEMNLLEPSPYNTTTVSNSTPNAAVKVSRILLPTSVPITVYDEYYSRSHAEVVSSYDTFTQISIFMHPVISGMKYSGGSHKLILLHSN